jgi:membrane associated rhomboid family serine protease
MVKGLIIATIGVFVVQLLAGPVVEFYLGLSPARAVSRLWVWQFVTYLFLHSRDNLFHILFNMLLLYWFGREIEEMLGPRRFLIFYLTAGAFAGVAHCVVQILGGMQVLVIGASGAIMAVMVAYAISFPDRMLLFFFLIPMKVRTCVLLLVGMDLFLSIQGSPGGVANCAHLGGALYGFLYWKGRPWFERAGDACRRWRESRKTTVDLQEEDDLDRILEKISQHGMNSLTKRERSYLLRASERRQRQRVPPEGHS